MTFVFFAYTLQMESGRLGQAGVHVLLLVAMVVFKQELEPVCRLVETALHKVVQ